MINHMEEVAKIFGVELGESFKITSGIQDDYKNYYRFTKNNCLETSADGVKWETAIAVVLKGILMGDTRIIKLPWKPINGEKYYIPYISISKENMYEQYHWSGDRTDEAFYEQGIVFKTKEEALAMSEKILAFVKKERQNDKSNREKAIADLCEYCVHGGDNGDCRTTTDSCYNSLKKWLEQE